MLILFYKGAVENLPYKIIVSRRKVIFARFKYGNIHIAFCSEFLKFGDSNLNSISIIFSSVAQSCLILCDPMDCSMPGFPVHHQLPELTQSHVHRVGDVIHPSHPLLSPSPCLLSFPALGSFPMSQFFASGGQSIGVSASASVLPMNIQD